MIDVQEKPRMVERAYLVGACLKQESPETAGELVEELRELVTTLGINVVGSHVVDVRAWQPKLLIGSGKAVEILEAMAEADADCLVFDNPLSPAQQRNWEAFSGRTTIDRQEVILDIFAARAQTREAKLQVELARMIYNLPRLKKAWSHLGRQAGGGAGGGGGGGGAQRGEGEQQIELDRRMVRDRISAMKRELEEVRAHRATQRKERSRLPVPHAAIVGYTNAGKSSLLRAISGSDIYVADKLFATLDTATRRIQLPNGIPLLLTDTVGFVRNLPHDLVDAFKATLEEAALSDFLIHVLDASSPYVEDFYRTTLDVLEELGAARKRMIVVFNKCDLLKEPGWKSKLLNLHPDAVLVSARTGEGMNSLRQRLVEQLADQVVHLTLQLPHDRGDLVAWLHEQAKVHLCDYEEDGVYLHVTLPSRLRSSVEAFIEDSPVKCVTN